jgi:hypothetical protein
MTIAMRPRLWVRKSDQHSSLERTATLELAGVMPARPSLGGRDLPSLAMTCNLVLARYHDRLFAEVDHLVSNAAKDQSRKV